MAPAPPSELRVQQTVTRVGTPGGCVGLWGRRFISATTLVCLLLHICNYSSCSSGSLSSSSRRVPFACASSSRVPAASFPTVRVLAPPGSSVRTARGSSVHTPQPLHTGADSLPAEAGRRGTASITKHLNTVLRTAVPRAVAAASSAAATAVSAATSLVPIRSLAGGAAFAPSLLKSRQQDQGEEEGDDDDDDDDDSSLPQDGAEPGLTGHVDRLHPKHVISHISRSFDSAIRQSESQIPALKVARTELTKELAAHESALRGVASGVSLQLSRCVRRLLSTYSLGVSLLWPWTSQLQSLNRVDLDDPYLLDEYGLPNEATPADFGLPFNEVGRMRIISIGPMHAAAGWEWDWSIKKKIVLISLSIFIYIYQFVYHLIYLLISKPVYTRINLCPLG
eukprot:GHVT01084639.1.p1 GENE.GHVT01084639.1~~GHVT01084639.1.p1  ORF type:complete len:395 (+),score=68.80 GHVT01084639.1:163-1347(+)